MVLANYCLLLTILANLALAQFTQPDGSVLNYHAGDHAHVQFGLPGRAVDGSYGFVSPEGLAITVNYIADENGYRAQVLKAPSPSPFYRPVGWQYPVSSNRPGSPQSSPAFNQPTNRPGTSFSGPNGAVSSGFGAPAPSEAGSSLSSQPSGPSLPLSSGTLPSGPSGPISEPNGAFPSGPSSAFSSNAGGVASMGSGTLPPRPEGTVPQFSGPSSQSPQSSPRPPVHPNHPTTNPYFPHYPYTHYDYYLYEKCRNSGQYNCYRPPYYWYHPKYRYPSTFYRPSQF